MDEPGSLVCIDDERCDSCALCVQVCEPGALELGERHAELTHPENCGGCALCEDVCPQAAITCSFEIVWGHSAGNSSDSKGGANA